MSDDQLLEIAAQLWQRHPGSAFTMDRLTDATGVSRASLYRRFGSREAILQRIAAEHRIDIEELSLPDIPTRILEATRVALNRFGFAGVTIEQIAQEAGVGPATVYRHFGSKEALLEAFMQAESPRHVLRSLVADAESDLEADLKPVAKSMLEFMRDNRGLIRVFAFENAGSETFVQRIRATQGRTINILADYLRGHMEMGHLLPADPFQLALSFIGILLGLGLIGPHSYERPITDAAATAHFATQLFLHGVAQSQPQPHTERETSLPQVATVPNDVNLESQS
jgi:AcrR family transcriptional regulator